MRLSALPTVVVLTLSALLHAALAAPSLRQSTGTISSLVSSSPDFTILSQLVSTAALGPTLSAAGPFTVFAPTDAAFATTAADFGYTGSADDKDAVADYLLTGARGIGKRLGADEKTSIAGLLSYHVSPKSLSSEDVIGMTEIETLLPGSSITRGAEGIDRLQLVDLAPAVADAKLVEDSLDLKASNGVVHAIDRMLQRGPITKELFQQAFAAAGGVQPSAADDADDADDAASASSSPGADAETAAASASASAEPSEDPSASVSPDPRAEATDEDDGSACFPASAEVHLADGSTKRMSDLLAGDVIRHDTTHLAAAVSPVYLFSHKSPETLHTFVRIETDLGHIVTISPNHYIHADGRMVTAGAVALGDVLKTLDGPAKVSAVSEVQEKGLFAPHTMHGDIVVDRVLASSYTKTLHPRVAHYALAPLRALVRMGVTEPLGGILYDGADGLAAWAPKGPAAF